MKVVCVNGTRIKKTHAIERKQKGGFVKGRFWRMCPRSGFWYWGTSAGSLVPVFGTGEHPNVPSFRLLVPGNIRQNHPFGNHPFANARIKLSFTSNILTFGCFFKSNFACKCCILVSHPKFALWQKECRKTGHMHSRRSQQEANNRK